MMLKYSPLPTNTLLHKEYRSWGAELDGNSNQAKHRRADDQRRDGHREIKEALPGTACPLAHNLYPGVIKLLNRSGRFWFCSLEEKLDHPGGG